MPELHRFSMRIASCCTCLLLLQACATSQLSSGTAPTVESTPAGAPAAAPAPTPTPPAPAPPVLAPPATDPEIHWTATPPAPDLWDRIRAGYDMPGLEHSRIDSELAWFARNQAYLDRVAQRAAPYLRHIVDELDMRGLPMELALLPVVESAFDPFAYSHGRAAGLWQFIPGTGRMYGLEQDWWHDERRDLPESTRAALEHLDDLREDFDGDWLLALAAYNAGPGNVRRAVRRNRAAGRPTDFFALDLPRETRAYVPRLLALARLVEDPGAHGVVLQSVVDQPYFEVVDTGGQIDLARAAELAEIDSERLYRLNPGLNRWATHPQGPHRLLVPVDHAEALRNGLASLPIEQRVSWGRHHIRPGESLSTIAARHQVDVATLQQANRLNGTRIRAGDALLIPTPARAPDAYVLSESQRSARRDARNSATEQGRERREHRVRAGESFWSIARTYDVAMRDLAAWNGMALADPLRQGQTLVLWQDPRPAAVTTGALPPSRQSVIRELAYRVRRGDSLWAIARRFDLTTRDILAWNGLEPERVLQPGQRLKLFVSVLGD